MIMNNNATAYRIAEIHNLLARVIANGVDLKSSDNVILVGNAMNELRVLAQELSVNEDVESVQEDQKPD